MEKRNGFKLIIATSSIVFLFAASAFPVLADSIPVNFVGVNFSPIISTTSYNYDWATGTLTSGTSTASVFSTVNIFQAKVSSPTPKDPNGYGTFIGTAHPTRFDGDTVVYTQSACPTGYPTCLSDGSFTYGYFVMYNSRGSTLDQLTALATQYNLQKGCFGGGSPRFSIIMSNNAEVQVYLGQYPAFTDCIQGSWISTGNLATDSSGLRWDSSQIGGSFYGTYSEAVTLANTQGLTISAIFLGTDGGWAGTNPTTTQTILFGSIQVNQVTRFP